MYRKNELKNFQQANIDQLYMQLVSASDKLVPFYRYYFTYYKPNKRLVVLDLLQKLRVYDATIYQTFVRQVQKLLQRETKLEKFREHIVTCDPLDNTQVDRLLQLVEVLDFDAEVRHFSGDHPSDSWQKTAEGESLSSKLKPISIHIKEMNKLVDFLLAHVK